MHNVMTIIGITRIHNIKVTPIDAQHTVIPRLATPQWVKYSGRQQHPAIDNFDNFAGECLLVTVLVKYFFCHCWIPPVGGDFYPA